MVDQVRALDNGGGEEDTSLADVPTLDSVRRGHGTLAVHSSEKLLNPKNNQMQTRRGDDLGRVLRHNGVQPLNMKKAAGSRDNGVLDNAAELLKLFTHPVFGCVSCSVCRKHEAMGPCLEALFDPLPEPHEQELCYVCMVRNKIGPKLEAGTGQVMGIEKKALNLHDQACLGFWAMPEVFHEWSHFAFFGDQLIKPMLRHTAEMLGPDLTDYLRKVVAGLAACAVDPAPYLSGERRIIGDFIVPEVIITGADDDGRQAAKRHFFMAKAQPLLEFVCCRASEFPSAKSMSVIRLATAEFFAVNGNEDGTTHGPRVCPGLPLFIGCDTLAAEADERKCGPAGLSTSLRSALAAWVTGRLAGTDDGWQAAFDVVDGGNDASAGAFDLELKLHIVVPVDHIRSYSAAAVASISEFAKSGALMAEATIRRQAAAFIDWHMTKEERLRHAHVVARGDAMERLMAWHDNGIRRSRTQRLVVTSAGAVNACNGGDGQIAQELLDNPKLAEARVNAARKGAPKREAAEAEASKAIDAVKHERHAAARAAAVLFEAAAATKKAEAVAYPLIMDVAAIPPDVTDEKAEGYPGNYSALQAELKVWAQRKYDKPLWGVIDGFKAHVHWNRYSTSKSHRHNPLTI